MLHMFGIAPVNHLSDKFSLIPDAESKCASLSLGELFGGEPFTFCSDLECHDFEGIEDVSLAKPADSSQRPVTSSHLCVNFLQALGGIPHELQACWVNFRTSHYPSLSFQSNRRLFLLR